MRWSRAKTWVYSANTRGHVGETKTEGCEWLPVHGTKEGASHDPTLPTKSFKIKLDLDRKEQKDQTILFY